MSKSVGRYKGIRSNMPVEWQVGQVTTSSVDAETNDDIDLVLEGQAAQIMMIDWEYVANGAEDPADTAIRDIIAALSMDRNYAEDLDGNYGSTMFDDEELVDHFRVKNNVNDAGTAANRYEINQVYREQHYFDGFGGIIVPERVRLRAIVDQEYTNINHVITCKVFYFRIEKPDQRVKDFLFRRR